MSCHVPGHPGNKHLNRPLSPRLMKNDLDTQHQRQFQSGKLASYAEKCSSTSIKNVKAVSGPYIPPVWHRRLRAMSTTKSWTLRYQKLTCQKSSFQGRLALSLHSRDLVTVPGWTPINTDSTQQSCPDCNATQHSVVHLFKCPMHQTDLTPLDLWLQPKEVAEFFNA